MADNKVVLSDADTILVGKDEVPHRMSDANAFETKKKKHDPYKYYDVRGDLATQVANSLFHDFEELGKRDGYKREISKFVDKEGNSVGEALIDAKLAIPMTPDQEFSQGLRYLADRDGTKPYSDEIKALREESDNLAAVQRSALKSVYFEPEADYQQSQIFTASDDNGKVSRAANRGWEQTQATIGAAAHAVGNAVGNQSLKEWGANFQELNLSQASLYDRDSRDLRSIFDDQSTSVLDKTQEAVTWAVESGFEEAIPLAVDLSIAAVLTPIGGAGAGYLATKHLVKRGAQKAISRYLDDKLAEKAVNKYIARKKTEGSIKAAKYGLYGSQLPQSIGEAEMTAQELGLESGGFSSIFTGLVTAGIDTTADWLLIGKLLKSRGLPDDSIKTITSRAKQVAKASAGQAGVEGITELTQEASYLTSAVMQGGDISKIAPDGDWETALAWRLGEAAAAGSVVGGATGATGATIGQALGIYDTRQSDQQRLIDGLSTLTTDEETPAEFDPSEKQSIDLEIDEDGNVNIHAKSFDTGVEEVDGSVFDEELGINTDNTDNTDAEGNKPQSILAAENQTAQPTADEELLYGRNLTTGQFMTQFNNGSEQEQRSMLSALKNKAQQLLTANPLLQTAFNRVMQKKDEYTPHAVMPKRSIDPTITEGDTRQQSHTFGSFIATVPELSKLAKDILSKPEYLSKLDLDPQILKVASPLQLKNLFLSMDSESDPLFSKFSHDLLNHISKNEKDFNSEIVGQLFEGSVHSRRRSFKYNNVGELQQAIITSFSGRSSAQTHDMLTDIAKTPDSSESYYNIFKTAGYALPDQIEKILLADPNSQLEDVIPNKRLLSDLIQGNFFHAREANFEKKLDEAPMQYGVSSTARIHEFIVNNAEPVFNETSDATQPLDTTLPAGLLGLFDYYQENIRGNNSPELVGDGKQSPLVEFYNSAVASFKKYGYEITSPEQLKNLLQNKNELRAFIKSNSPLDNQPVNYDPDYSQVVTGDPSMTVVTDDEIDAIDFSAFEIDGDFTDLESIEGENLNETEEVTSSRYSIPAIVKKVVNMFSTPTYTKDAELQDLDIFITNSVISDPDLHEKAQKVAAILKPARNSGLMPGQQMLSGDQQQSASELLANRPNKLNFLTKDDIISFAIALKMPEHMIKSMQSDNHTMSSAKEMVNTFTRRLGVIAPLARKAQVNSAFAKFKKAYGVSATHMLHQAALNRRAYRRILETLTHRGIYDNSDYDPLVGLNAQNSEALKQAGKLFKAVINELTERYDDEQSYLIDGLDGLTVFENEVYGLDMERNLHINPTDTLVDKTTFRNTKAWQEFISHPQPDYNLMDGEKTNSDSETQTTMIDRYVSMARHLKKKFNDLGIDPTDEQAVALFLEQHGIAFRDIDHLARGYDFNHRVVEISTLPEPRTIPTKTEQAEIDEAMTPLVVEMGGGRVPQPYSLRLNLNRLIDLHLGHFGGNEASLIPKVFNAFTAVSSTLSNYSNSFGHRILNPRVLLTDFDPETVIWRNPLPKGAAKINTNRDINQNSAVMRDTEYLEDRVTIGDLLKYQEEQGRLADLTAQNEADITHLETSASGVSMIIDLMVYYNELDKLLSNTALPAPAKKLLQHASGFVSNLIENNAYKYGISDSDYDDLTIAIDDGDINFIQQYRKNSHDQEIGKFMERKQTASNRNYTYNLYEMVTRGLKDEAVFKGEDSKAIRKTLKNILHLHHRMAKLSSTVTAKSLTDPASTASSRSTTMYDGGYRDNALLQGEQLEDGTHALDPLDMNHEIKHVIAVQETEFDSKKEAQRQKIRKEKEAKLEAKQDQLREDKEEYEKTMEYHNKSVIFDNDTRKYTARFFQAVADSLIKSLNLKGRVSVFSGELTAADSREIGKSATRHYNELRASEQPFSFIAGDQFIVHIPYNPTASGVTQHKAYIKSLFQLGHEFGHLLYQNALANGVDLSTLHTEYDAETKGDTITFEEWFSDKAARGLFDKRLLDKATHNTFSEIVTRLYDLIIGWVEATKDAYNSLFTDRQVYFTHSESMKTFIANSMKVNRPTDIKTLKDADFYFNGAPKYPHNLTHNAKHLGTSIKKGFTTLQRRAGHLDTGFRSSIEQHKVLRRQLFANLQGSLVRPSAFKDRHIQKAYTDALTGVQSREATLLKEWFGNMRTALGDYKFIPDDAFEIPKRINVAALQKNPDRFKLIAEKAFYDPQGRPIIKMHEVIENLIDNDGFISPAINDDLTDPKPPKHSAFASNLFKNNSVVAELAKNGYLDTNGFDVVHGYIKQVSHYTAYGDAFGASVKHNNEETLLFDTSAKMRVYLSRASADDKEEMLYLHRALTGHLNKSMPYRLRVGQDYLLATSNMSILAFAGVASLPDLGTTAIRTRSFKIAAKGLLRLASNPKFAWQISKAIGIASSQYMHQTVNDMWTNGDTAAKLPSQVQKLFFHLNGQSSVNALSQMLGVSMGHEMLVEVSTTVSESNNRLINEYAINPKLIAQAIALGDMTTAHTTQQKLAVKHYHEALTRFVTGSMMVGERAHQPALKQNPWAQMLMNLKSFFYEFHQLVSVEIYDETKARAKGMRSIADLPHVIEPIAIAAVLLMPLAALGWELREWLRDGKSPSKLPSDEYWLKLISRTGALSLGELVMPFYYAEQYNRPYITAAIPVASQWYDVIKADEWGQKAKRISPFINQGVPKKWNPFD